MLQHADPSRERDRQERHLPILEPRKALYDEDTALHYSEEGNIF